MNLGPWRRVIVALFFLGLVFVSGIHYASVEASQSPYPTEEELKTNPAEYIGEEVFVFGTVKRVESQENTATIRIESDRGSVIVQVDNFSPQLRVEPGGIVQVYGTWQEPNVITAENVRVVNPTGSTNLYKYAVSGVAALVIVVLFFRYWRVNFHDFAFEVR